MNRAAIKRQNKQLDMEIAEIVDAGLEKIAKLLAKKDRDIEEIISIIYSILEKVYSTVIASLKETYTQLKDFDVEDIRSLTYQEDGKTIEDRVEIYLDEETDIVSTLYRFYVLLMNESRIIKRVLVEHRVKPIASILVIECEEEDCHFGCDEYAGEYPADEPIELPPYHPNCNCTYYFIETDNVDDIEDLDLEVDEL